VNTKSVFFKFLSVEAANLHPPTHLPLWMRQCFRAQVPFKPISIQYDGSQRSNCPQTLSPFTHTQIWPRELTDEISSTHMIPERNRPTERDQKDWTDNVSVRTSRRKEVLWCYRWDV
jgi:hypothetical protein